MPPTNPLPFPRLNLAPVRVAVSGRPAVVAYVRLAGRRPFLKQAVSVGERASGWASPGLLTVVDFLLTADPIDFLYFLVSL